MKLKVVKKQNNSDMCIVCGLKNALSLGTRFYAVEGEMMVGVVTGRDEHQSYPNRMHGGMISALLDEVIGRAVNVPEPEAFGVTTEMNVKFKKPVPLNEELKVVGKLTKNTVVEVTELAMSDASVWGKVSYTNDKDTDCNKCGFVRFTKGDVDRVEGVDLNDAIYLLYHVNFKDTYPVGQPVDFDGSGTVDLNDAIYLLYHVNFKDTYPLH